MRDCWEAEDEAIARGDLAAAAALNAGFWVGPAAAGVRERVRAMQLRALELQAGVGDDPEDMLVPDVADRLAEIAAPALVLAGELDHPDILVIAERLEDALPNSASARIPAAAHLPSLKRPAAFDAVVAPFVAGVT